jgi:hypothetical protein
MAHTRHTIDGDHLIDYLQTRYLPDNLCTESREMILTATRESLRETLRGVLARRAALLLTVKLDDRAKAFCALCGVTLRPLAVPPPQLACAGLREDGNLLAVMLCGGCVASRNRTKSTPIPGNECPDRLDEDNHHDHEHEDDDDR